MRGDVRPIALHYAGVLVLIAGDAFTAEVVEDLLLDVRLKHLPPLELPARDKHQYPCSFNPGALPGQGINCF